MNASVPGSLYRIEVEVIPLLEKLLNILYSGRIGPYEAGLIDRVVKWLRNEENTLDAQLVEDLNLVVQKATLAWHERETLKEAIKAIESTVT